MFYRFIRLWEFLQHSLWALPFLFGLAGILLALAAVNLPPSDPVLPPPWPHFEDTADMRSLITTLLAALVTMTTFALSITMVVLTLAAGSLGPRMIRNFMGDIKTQCALGIFLGSILFLITTLVLMGAGEARQSAPQLAAVVGVTLFVISILVLVLFVHHLGRSIVADQVILTVGDNLEATISSARSTLDTPIQDAQQAAITLLDPNDARRDLGILAPSSGYIQGIDYQELCRVADQDNIDIRLFVHAGQHVITGEVIGDCPSITRQNHSDLACKVAACVMIGDNRTAALDIEFSLRQLVEIALRALSPGINDPFTAIASVYRLGRALRHATSFHYPVGLWKGVDGVPRLTGQLSDFNSLTGAAFNQIRQAASAKPDVLIPMAEVLESLLSAAETAHQRDEIRRQAQMILRAAKRNIAEPDDCSAVERAAMRVLRSQAERT